MTYTEAVNDYGWQEEFWNGEKLREISAYNEAKDVPIFYKIVKKYNNDPERDIHIWAHEDNTVTQIKIKFINIINHLTSDEEKLEIIEDMLIACEEWESRYLRRNIRKLMEAIVNEEIKWNNDDYDYTDELKQVKKAIEQDIYYYLNKYNIESSFGIKCNPLGNGFMHIDIHNSNKLNETQINAIERIIRGHYTCGKVKFDRNGSIQKIDHRFTTKYYAGRYVHR